jgi:hypothetical protein
MNLEQLAERQVSKLRSERERNRALAAKHMPDFLRLFDDCKALGMEPRMVHFEIYEKDKAA